VGNRVTIEPETFSLVEFDRGELTAIIEKLLDDIGLSGPVRLEIDQTTPLGHTRVESVEPLELFAESGALEDPKRIRKLSAGQSALVLGRLLFRVRDRQDPAFVAGGEPPADKDLTVQQRAAWDAYTIGRLVRLGYTYQADRQARLYDFRTRHGFTDVSDANFAALWDGEGLSWADIERLSQEAKAATAAVA
jgi:hypothetical protein